ncbi:MAG TPA: bifunctional precorrin-2 dehydrogenase/sirohydrochlorin ferrochelatase, partial [Acidimicrobiales bacterium]|nr:bifunctional precorrin-2 dehydrogenase/sirohydrochlorin ferrochelatase [Acidimicrobiales bacterium]
MIDGPLFPVHLRLTGRRCLVVGGGRVAARKVHNLVECGALVTVVAPEVAEELEALPGVVCERRSYRSGEVAGFRFVVAATGDPDVDGEVFRDGESAGVWVNAADDPEHCSAVLPAVTRRGPIVATFSTSGRSPAMASWLRRRYEDELGPEHLVLLDLLAEQRDRLRGEGRPTEGLDWQEALDSGMLDLVREG